MGRAPGSGAGEAPDHAAGFLADVLHGLSRQQKSIPGKYLWDQAGSELFDRNCDTPDDYPTGREVALLRRHAERVAGLVGPEVSLVEFGSGAGHKIRILLDAFDRPKRYVAIEIAEAFLAAAAKRIARDYPLLSVISVTGDCTKALSLPPLDGDGPVLGFFPGTAVGNLDGRDVVGFLSRARAALGPGWFRRRDAFGEGQVASRHHGPSQRHGEHHAEQADQHGLPERNPCRWPMDHHEAFIGCRHEVDVGPGGTVAFRIWRSSDA